MNKKNYLDKQKGYSIPGVLTAMMIVAIIGGATYSALWGSVDKAKINTIASLIKEQRSVFVKEPTYDYDALNMNNDFDYLPEMVANGLLTAIPDDLFEEPAALTWQIRKNVLSGYKVIYYVVVNSTNANDKALIDAAIAKIGMPIDNLNVIP